MMCNGNPFRKRFYTILRRLGGPKNLPKSIKMGGGHLTKTFLCWLLINLVAFLAQFCIFFNFDPIWTSILGHLGPVWSPVGLIFGPFWPYGCNFGMGWALLLESSILMLRFHVSQCLRDSYHPIKKGCSIDKLQLTIKKGACFHHSVQ